MHPEQQSRNQSITTNDTNADMNGHEWSTTEHTENTEEMHMDKQDEQNG